jgi:hypothetical protein
VGRGGGGGGGGVGGGVQTLFREDFFGNVVFSKKFQKKMSEKKWKKSIEKIFFQKTKFSLNHVGKDT